MKTGFALGGFTSDGIWVSRPANRQLGPRGLFLDRDGVLIEDIGYVGRVEDVSLIQGVQELLHGAQAAGIATVVVTNQSGIDRKMFDWSAYQEVEAEIARRLQMDNIEIDLTVACPFHRDFTPGYGASHDGWRKPGPGMLQLAGGTLGIELSKSWLVGDSWTDIGAARAAGLAGAVYIGSSDVNLNQYAASGSLFEVKYAKDVREAHRILARCFFCLPIS